MPVWHATAKIQNGRCDRQTPLFGVGGVKETSNSLANGASVYVHY
jgi:hypothetical protein